MTDARDARGESDDSGGGEDRNASRGSFPPPSGDGHGGDDVPPLDLPGGSGRPSGLPDEFGLPREQWTNEWSEFAIDRVSLKGDPEGEPFRYFHVANDYVEPCVIEGDTVLVQILPEHNRQIDAVRPDQEQVVAEPRAGWAVEHPVADRLYVVCIGDQVQIAGLTVDGSTATIVPGNPDYASFEVDLQSHDLSIVGVVEGRVSRREP